MINSRFYPPGLLPGIVERRRLFELLDRALEENRAVWIAAPPGAGKTTLIAAYTGHRRSSCLWYQLDAADADPATFFQYLAASADVVAPDCGSLLPRLTPEYTRGLPAFTRRFSEILFGSLPSRCLLVFDNCQELTAESPVYELLCRMAGSAGREQHFVFISRETPPPQLARLQVNRQLQMLGWEQIRFTPEECDAFLALDGGVDADVSARIIQTANGWIAGLILMKNSGGRLLREKSGCVDHQLIFDYFAVEIVSHMPDAVHGLLLNAAVFKLFTPEMLARLCSTDERSVAEVLSGLHARQFFIGRDRQDEPHYQLHPLFRHYLLAECVKRIGRAGFLELQRCAAAIALKDGQLDAAVELMLECEDWEQLAGLCLTNAQQLLQAGRHKNLLDWMEKLPAAMRENDPWLSLWHGCAQIPYNPNAALEKFGCAYRIFKSGGDVMGSYLAWSSAVEGLNYAWDNFNDAPFWLGEFEELRSVAPHLPAELEARVLPALVSLLIWVEFGIGRFPGLIERCYELLRQASDPTTEAALSGAILYFHSTVSASAEASDALVEKMHVKIVQGAALPVSKLGWFVHFIVHCTLSGKYQKGEEAMAQALRLVDESGARVLEAVLLCQVAALYIARKDLKSTDAMLRRVEEVVVKERRIERLLYHFIYSSRCLLADRSRATQALLEEGYKLAAATGATAPQVIQAGLLCHMHLCFNEPEQARSYYELLRSISAKAGNRGYTLQGLFLKSRFAKQANDSDGFRSALTEALQYARKNGIINALGHPFMIEDLYRDALRYGIERDYVVKIIRRLQLQPGDDEDFCPDWPWPIRIAVLGGFRVEVGGSELILSKKQKRVLELLMLLIVSHREALSKERIKNIIWPEADPAKAEQNFRSTLTRLRKFLSHDAVLWKDAAVSLNKKIIWADYWELESRLRRPHDGDTGIPAGETGGRIFELYRGRLLPGENHSWLLVGREQLHRKCCAVFLEYSRGLLEAGDSDGSLSVLNRALAVDHTVEAFYQLQMQALIRKGLYAEAVKSYQSCASVLSAQLKILPSAETKRIYESIPRS